MQRGRRWDALFSTFYFHFDFGMFMLSCKFKLILIHVLDTASVPTVPGWSPSPVHFIYTVHSSTFY